MSSYFSSDTIAAIATSLAGDGGVGIIRLSGKNALEASKSVCEGFKEPTPRYLHRITVQEGGEVLDDGLGVYFPKGQSFTGEEVVELQLHGGRFLLQHILRKLLETKLCRMALPGEFSFRAVREGKLSLSGAEVVQQIVAARSTFEVLAARRSLGEARLKEFDEISAEIRNLLAQTELSIDFIDQDVEVVSAANAKERVERLAVRVSNLLEKLRSAQRLAQGVRVTLLGNPNAGKSTLFNALLSEDRAIVSAEAGTTRDIITEEFALGPYRLRLADTAGMREASGMIEREGIARAISTSKESDLGIVVVDALEASTLEERDALALIPGESALPRRWILVLNKWSLVDDKAKAKLLSLYSVKAGANAPIGLDALSGNGLQALLDRIKTELDSDFGAALTAFLPTEFQLQMLLLCKGALEQAETLLKTSGLSQPELLSAALFSSVRALSDLVGETTPDTVLNKIFSEFCIGK